MCQRKARKRRVRVGSLSEQLLVEAESELDVHGKARRLASAGYACAPERVGICGRAALEAGAAARDPAELADRGRSRAQGGHVRVEKPKIGAGRLNEG